MDQIQPESSWLSKVITGVRVMLVAAVAGCVNLVAMSSVFFSETDN
jgi:hypothetical protein